MENSPILRQNALHGFGTRKTFTNISVIPQKLPSFLLGSEKLSYYPGILFSPDKGPDCPMTYIEPLQYRSGSEEGYRKWPERSELVDERVSRARQALCDIANVLVAGLSIGEISCRKVWRSREGRICGTRDDYAMFACRCRGGVAPSPRQLADQVRTLLHKKDKQNTQTGRNDLTQRLLLVRRCPESRTEAAELHTKQNVILSNAWDRTLRPFLILHRKWSKRLPCARVWHVNRLRLRCAVHRQFSIFIQAAAR